MRANEVEMPRDTPDSAEMMKSAHESAHAPQHTPLTQAILGKAGDDIGIADDNSPNPFTQISQSLDTPEHPQDTEESQGASPRPRRSYLSTGKGLESKVSNNSLKIDNSYYPIATPKNEREALASAQKDEWMSAMKKKAEMQEIWNMGTYTLVPRPGNTHNTL